MADLAAQLRARIAVDGPLPFDVVVEAALYDPVAGFYASAGAAGRRGDFLTSPELGPLFGAVVARALDRWWDDLGAPDRFRVVEAGAGRGALARALRAAGPRCAGALELVLVERSAALRSLHEPLVADGLVASSLGALPAPDGPAVVLANELLDNVPFRVAERTAGGWAEVRVGVVGDRLGEVVVAEPAMEVLHALAPDAPVGARVPWQPRAAAWVDAARLVAGAGGRVLTFDYAGSTAALATRPPEAWARTYRSHAPGTGPLEDLGAQDITVDVAVDQLPPAEVDCSQAEWLRAHGIDELVDEGRRSWADRAHVGDLAAVRARSRVLEADALLEPTGLGGFRALEWAGTDQGP